MMPTISNSSHITMKSYTAFIVLVASAIAVPIDDETLKRIKKSLADEELKHQELHKEEARSYYGGGIEHGVITGLSPAASTTGLTFSGVSSGPAIVSSGPVGVSGVSLAGSSVGSGLGSTIGLFPNVKPALAIPLLLSCSPTVVSGQLSHSPGIASSGVTLVSGASGVGVGGQGIGIGSGSGFGVGGSGFGVGGSGIGLGSSGFAMGSGVRPVATSISGFPAYRSDNFEGQMENWEKPGL